ncbi:C-type lectin domain family 2 member D11-like [Perognathus longimembris pacificus]|uniref:C-type lectin domain family 2 member D11-like n=1 Tax=Perognathus longimembris pacificus TaxID=214514 RepID=UPI002018685F|nr:C-type lectin domain family 2 member D11-like [Perognathus longimembris pacificus]XP_048191119.1 C-type lectin domain family 2 member D11-like [Perognathus longimembris pacificus]
MAPPEALGGTLRTDLLSTHDPEGRPADGEPGSRVCVKALHGRCLRAPPPLSPAQVGCSLLGNVVLAAAVVGLVAGLAATQRGSRVAEVRTLYASCPTHWIGFGSQCFYFSDDVRNWTSSQAFCESLDANLARFDSMEELVRKAFGGVLLSAMC